ncbi:hypothetical protein Vretifemale_8688 [Volvox reticuliferus]|uniref:Uncharacterized protein n=1 Tax=Volvox reticuliferus TaxID=1737510 RepID=A0A8J4CEH8_9CHLO|nr:hypothetical protein Vretifemale_8688 [Volvox reticuliferus]
MPHKRTAGAGPWIPPSYGRTEPSSPAKGMDTEVAGAGQGGAAGPSVVPAELPGTGAWEVEAAPPSGSLKGITKGLLTLASSLLYKRGGETRGMGQGADIIDDETEDGEDDKDDSADDSSQDEEQAALAEKWKWGTPVEHDPTAAAENGAVQWEAADEAELADAGDVHASGDAKDDDAAEAELVEAAQTLLASARAAPFFDVPAVKQKRGRPRKHKPQSTLTEDEKLALRGANTGTPKRKRGRPPKQKKTKEGVRGPQEDAAVADISPSGYISIAAATGAKRKRGRPPKNKAERAAAVDAGEDGGAGSWMIVGKAEEDVPAAKPHSNSKEAVSGASSNPHKRKRGRPPKNEALRAGTSSPGPEVAPAGDVDGAARDVDDDVVAAMGDPPAVKRKRGRPRKHKPQLAAQEAIKAETGEEAGEELLPFGSPGAQADIPALEREHDRMPQKEKKPQSEGKEIAAELQVADAARGDEEDANLQPLGATLADRTMVKRKRGRPPKQKQKVEEGAEAAEDAAGENSLSITLPAAVAASGEKRKRGRPPKKKFLRAGVFTARPEEDVQAGNVGDVDGAARDVDDDVAAMEDAPAVKRKRGRPRKQKPQRAAQEAFGAMAAEEVVEEDDAAARHEDAPTVKRKRGRPPKHKPHSTAGTTTEAAGDAEQAGELLSADADTNGAQDGVPKRKRGRPPKRSNAEQAGELPNDDADTNGAQDGVPKRKRGRPPKRSNAEQAGELPNDDADTNGAQDGVPKRKRGRPPKRSYVEQAGELPNDDADTNGAQEGVPKRKRGRPPKRSNAEQAGGLLSADAGTNGAQEGVPKRKRGRPRKHKSLSVATEAGPNTNLQPAVDPASEGDDVLDEDEDDDWTGSS